MDKFLVKYDASTRKRPIQEGDEDPDDPGFNPKPPVAETQLSLSEDLTKSYLFNGQFFTIIQCDGDVTKLVAKCKNCSKVIHGQKRSTENFLSHIKVIIIH